MVLRKCLLLIPILAACCAHQNTEPRFNELLKIKKIVVSADSAFAAYYVFESNKIIEALKRDGMKVDAYKEQITLLNVRQAYIATLIKSINMAVAKAYIDIKEGRKSASLEHARFLLEKLVKEVTNIGVLVYE